VASVSVDSPGSAGAMMFESSSLRRTFQFIQSLGKLLCRVAIHLLYAFSEAIVFYRGVLLPELFVVPHPRIFCMLAGRSEVVNARSSCCEFTIKCLTEYVTDAHLFFLGQGGDTTFNVLRVRHLISFLTVLIEVWACQLIVGLAGIDAHVIDYPIFSGRRTAITEETLSVPSGTAFASSVSIRVRSTSSGVQRWVLAVSRTSAAVRRIAASLSRRRPASRSAASSGADSGPTGLVVLAGVVVIR
jgi:hypothetical protein